MTQAGKLEALVQRAIDRGWEFDNLDKWTWGAIKKTDTVMNNWYYFLITYDGKEQFIDAERILYDHDFAKALWGDVPNDWREANMICYPAHRSFEKPEAVPLWQYHLQQAVISEDPIGYMYKEVFGE